MVSTVLKAVGLTKRYGSFLALDSVGFELKAGEVHGLCGENGAGKSTLIKILGGVVKPECGSVVVGGLPLVLGARVPPEMISIVHQELSVIPDLSVIDNVFLNSQVSEFYLRGKLVTWCRSVLVSVGLEHINPYQSAGSLTLAEQQLLEIARGIVSGAKVLLLDEPTATLTEAEISKVFSVLRKLKAGGSTIVIVSHRLDEIFDVTDRVSVFRSGRHILTENTAGLTREELVEAMIGRSVVSRDPVSTAAKATSASNVLEVKDYMLKGRFGPLNFSVHKGSIVALVGQLGSGADIAIESLAGLHPGTSGALKIDQHVQQVRSIHQSMKLGISYVPEDRARKGVFLDERIDMNITSQILGGVSKCGFIVESRAVSRARKLAEQFTIAASRLSLPVSALSGGNQQKVALAKAVAASPRLLLLNEPTRGVDIGARSDIYINLKKLTAEGMSVLLYSSDLEEVMDVADIIVTIHKGTQVRVLSKNLVSSDNVLSDILHGADEGRA